MCPPPRDLPDSKDGTCVSCTLQVILTLCAIGNPQISLFLAKRKEKTVAAQSQMMFSQSGRQGIRLLNNFSNKSV